MEDGRRGMTKDQRPKGLRVLLNGVCVQRRDGSGTPGQGCGVWPGWSVKSKKAAEALV
jgi:hypothetical protein